ncbi:hypothetical protein [Luteimonas sp. R10]|uniref:hypothetical protein n=1 Tax=Luteimonas sp. R10 TaxID=3108176 RepID=UPI00308C53D7|nr:hypothetical protein U3649_02305 [Luteimonas sp. R10]
MRLVLATAIFACSLQLAAQPHHHELEFSQASELLPWCEAEARAHFVGKGVTTYQWTGRYYDKGNVLFVEGKLRANGNDVPVACRVARGGRERYAIVEINEST